MADHINGAELDQEDRADDQLPLTGAEGEALIASAWRSRRADRELAAALRRPEPTGAPTTAGYLDKLAHQGPLPAAVERELGGFSRPSRSRSCWRCCPASRIASARSCVPAMGWTVKSRACARSAPAWG